MKWFKGVPEITLSITIIHLFVKIVILVNFVFPNRAFFLSRRKFKMMQVARYELSLELFGFKIFTLIKTRKT